MAVALDLDVARKIRATYTDLMSRYPFPRIPIDVCKEIAPEYGVHYRTIERIIKNDTYKEPEDKVEEEIVSPEPAPGTETEKPVWKKRPPLDISEIENTDLPVTENDSTCNNTKNIHGATFTCSKIQDHHDKHFDQISRVWWFNEVKLTKNPRRK